MATEADIDDPEYYRREAMGAFAHEVRTPLTSIRMVMELARRQSAKGQLLLDSELAEMLNTSIDDLQQLADDLQETSRLERGKLPLSHGPCDLAAAIHAAGDLCIARIEPAGDIPAGVEGPWDAARLVRALAGFAGAANRMGDGSGAVNLTCERRPAKILLHFESGTPTRSARPIAADAGFAFFRSRQFVLAMGGSVDCDRSERYARITVRLPLLVGDGG